MKIAISGKGGVGKTTLAALLAQTWAERGRAVLAVDADPSPCLADSLGFPSALRHVLRPVSEMESLIEERTGTKKGAGGFFRMTPHVEDLPGRFSVVYRGVRLLAMGSVQAGGGGCMCGENALLRALLTHLLFGDEDVLIVDMHAGVEHLGRATVDSVDAMLVVAEPTRRSLATAGQIRELAADLGLTRLWLVGNRVRGSEDVAFLSEQGPDLPLLGWVPVDPQVEEAERLGLSAWEHAGAARAAAEGIADAIEARVARGQ